MLEFLIHLKMYINFDSSSDIYDIYSFYLYLITLFT